MVSGSVFGSPNPVEREERSFHQLDVCERRTQEQENENGKLNQKLDQIKRLERDEN